MVMTRASRGHGYPAASGSASGGGVRQQPSVAAPRKPTVRVQPASSRVLATKRQLAKEQQPKRQQSPPQPQRPVTYTDFISILASPPQVERSPDHTHRQTVQLPACSSTTPAGSPVPPLPARPVSPSWSMPGTPNIPNPRDFRCGLRARSGSPTPTPTLLTRQTSAPLLLSSQSSLQTQVIFEHQSHDGRGAAVEPAAKETLSGVTTPTTVATSSLAWSSVKSTSCATASSSIDQFPCPASPGTEASSAAQVSRQISAPPAMRFQLAAPARPCPDARCQSARLAEASCQPVRLVDAQLQSARLPATNEYVLPSALQTVDSQPCAVVAAWSEPVPKLAMGATLQRPRVPQLTTAPGMPQSVALHVVSHTGGSVVRQASVPQLTLAYGMRENLAVPVASRDGGTTVQSASLLPLPPAPLVRESAVPAAPRGDGCTAVQQTSVVQLSPGPGGSPRPTTPYRSQRVAIGSVASVTVSPRTPELRSPGLLAVSPGSPKAMVTAASTPMLPGTPPQFGPPQCLQGLLAPSFSSCGSSDAAPLSAMGRRAFHSQAKGSARQFHIRRPRGAHVSEEELKELNEGVAAEFHDESRIERQDAHRRRNVPDHLSGSARTWASTSQASHMPPAVQRPLTQKLSSDRVSKSSNPIRRTGLNENYAPARDVLKFAEAKNHAANSRHRLKPAHEVARLGPRIPRRARQKNGDELLSL